MEPALWELTEGDADEEVEVIMRLHRPDQLPPSVRVVAQFGTVVTARLRRGAIVETRQDETVASMKAPMLLTPGDDIPPLTDEESIYEPTPESDNRRPRVEQATGRGVVVGVVDWGCDFTHPNFRHEDGTTRLLALWDQGAAYRPRQPNRYGYGVIHSADEIDRALASDDPIAALGYDFYSSDPGSGTHGTHVLDIAAGNGRAGGPSGVAPEADLVFVHLHNRGLPSQANLGSSVAVMEATDFILRVAHDRPVVLNLSMGRQMGPHDGSTLVEQAFDALVSAAPGRAIVQSTGNYYDRMAHSSGQLLPGQVRSIAFTVSEADVTPNELEIWYPGRDVFALEVRTPTGIVSKQTGLDDQASIRIDDRIVCRIYHRSREPNNLDNNCHVYIEPGAPAGAWEIILTGIDVVDGRFNIWIERDATCPDCQSRFDEAYAVPLMTTGTICNGLRTVAVGAYNAHDPARGLGRFSSCGPTRDLRTKPNLIAPGVQVLAARSRPRFGGEPRLYLTRKSGTSMAAPHVTGAIALMFEVAGAHKLPNNETLNLLLGSAVPADVSGDQAHRVGSGYLDLDAALANTRRFVEPKQAIPAESEPVVEGDMVTHAEAMSEDTDEGVETAENAEWGETEWVESAESALETEAWMPVQTHLQRVMQRFGLPAVPSLHDLYRTFARPDAAARRQQFEPVFDVVMLPGAPPVDGLRPGDMLLRRIPGDSYVHVAFIGSRDLLPAQQAMAQGWTLETLRPGYYTIVIEAGANPHRLAQRFARLVLDRRGFAPPNHLVLRRRRRRPGAAETTEAAEGETAEDLGENEHEHLLEEDIAFAENNPPPMIPTKTPAALPVGDPVPFAPPPAAGSFWPIITTHRLGRTVSFLADDGTEVGTAGRRFLARRSGGGRNHAAVDLFANFDDPVVAIEDGDIVSFFGFCCGETQTTNALMISHANVVVNYGEVAPDSLRRAGLRVGSSVRAGQIVGFIGRNPGGSSMLHLETYVQGTRRNARWPVGARRPASLLNPTQYLLHLQQHGLAGTPGGATPPAPPIPVPPIPVPPLPMPPSTGGPNRRSPAYIRWVQSSLNQIANAGLVVDGVIGPRTRAAVRAFQQSRGLTADGIVGPQTEAALVAAGAAPPPGALPLVAPMPLLETDGAPNRRNPEYIRWVQTSLNQISNAGLVVDGISGPRTRAAVRAFQQSRGLTADGNVGPQTEAALMAAGAAPPPGMAPPVPPPLPIPPLPIPPTPTTATDVSPAFVLAVTPLTFRNSANINDFYRLSTGADFVDWFNNNIARREHWARLRLGQPGDAAAIKTRFNRIWDRIPEMFGTSSINLFQFLSLLSIIINETGGSLLPISERVGRSGHPGIAYAFDRIPNVKASYNRGGNRTALDLFNAPEFLAAHGHLPLADRVRNTTDARWGGEQYPQNDFPTSTNPAISGIILEADFYKFRGRGLIQTTFRSAYKHIIEHIQANAMGHPIVDDYRRRWAGLSSETVATVSTNDDWDRLFQQTDLLIPALGVRLHSQRSGNYLVMPLNADVLNRQGRGSNGSIWNVGRRVSGSESYANLFRSRVLQILNAMGNGAAATP